ncbi:MAG: hypothetical protein JWR89_4217 [Tardiphaga sp.]|jgi:hypothetical protein|uniref:hypothetical protein n=1 Tax=Tardiphaga sp. TaxID=1926292 RepID=UPI002601B58F|nr:hypothetical protein [Tardiphaga sp.]MDB5504315.1 hypothetical protein [Tardiphaga sp.]
MISRPASSQFFRAAAICAALGLSGSAAYAQSAPFAGMAGVWSGNGTISLEDGSKERIRCKATYAVSSEGNGLNQALLCASDSYKFELKSDVIAKAGTLSGTWAETTRNVSGSLEGRAGNGQFNVTVSAPAFTAKLTMTTNGNKQNVAISSEGAFKGANISLSRS